MATMRHLAASCQPVARDGTAQAWRWMESRELRAQPSYQPCLPLRWCPLIRPGNKPYKMMLLPDDNLSV